MQQVRSAGQLGHECKDVFHFSKLFGHMIRMLVVHTGLRVLTRSSPGFEVGPVGTEGTEGNTQL